MPSRTSVPSRLSLRPGRSLRTRLARAPRTGLTATAAGPTQINLAWTASTDNVGVTGYRVERCQGSGYTNFVQIAQPASRPGPGRAIGRGRVNNSRAKR